MLYKRNNIVGYLLVPRTVNRESSMPENYGKGFSAKCMIYLSYLA
jgi:hypothetical protein